MSEEIIKVGDFVYPCPLDKLPKLVDQFDSRMDYEDGVKDVLGGSACWCDIECCSVWDESEDVPTHCSNCILCTNYGDRWADRVKAFLQFAEEHGYDMCVARKKLGLPRETCLEILTEDIFKDYPTATCAAVDDSGECWVYYCPPEEVICNDTCWDVEYSFLKEHGHPNRHWMELVASYDSTDWKYSKIINEKKKETEMAKKPKKLTAQVFGYVNCPKDAKCAVVDEKGTAHWCITNKVEPFYGDWTLTKEGSKEVSSRDISRSPIWREIGEGFDASDWKNSMVLRKPKGVREDILEKAAKVESGLPDSGKREEFESGAVRDVAEDKPRPDLISPFFLERLGEHLRKGAIKYDEHNWAKGIPNSRCYASLMRHLTKYAQGLTDEDHLAAAAFNLMAIIHNEEVAKRGAKLVQERKGLVDMPVYQQVN